MPMHRLSAPIAALLVIACDIPTELPKWDTTFVVQAEGASISVGQVLPASVTITGNGTAFDLALNPSNFSSNLGTLCNTCAALNGQFAPKPAFSNPFGTTIALPADVAAAALTSGTVNLSIQNGFSFDPLRPSATARGSMTITIRSNGALVGMTTVSGTTAFPPGTPLLVAIPLTAATLSNALDVTVLVDSPAGDPAQINTSELLTATATPTNLIVSSAQVRVTNRQVSTTQVLKLSSIDSFVSDHVKSGALLLAINNPFGVTGTLTLTLTGGTRTITKQVAIATGPSNVEVPFDQSEMQAILGQDVTMTISGPLSAPGNVSLTPALVVSVTSKLKLVLGPEN